MVRGAEVGMVRGAEEESSVMTGEGFLERLD
jgi:hypothetical protein